MKRIAVFLSLVAIVACGSSTENALGNPIGNYTLLSVDGSTVPALIGTTVTVRGSLNLKNSGDYAFTQADSAISGAVTLTSTSGKWGLTDNALSLIPNGGGIDLGILTLDTIRLTHVSHTNIYVRR